MDKKQIIAAFTKKAPQPKVIPCYDKAVWHDVTKLDLPPSCSFTPGGMFMAWAVTNNLLSKDFADEGEEDIDAYLNDQLSAGSLYRWLHGYLHPTMFKEECNSFLQAYYGVHSNNKAEEISPYWSDLKSAMEAEGSIYQIADSTSNMQIVSQILDSRFEEFKKRHKEAEYKPSEITWAKLSTDKPLAFNSSEWLEAEYKKLHKYDDVIQLPLTEDEFYFSHGSLFIEDKNYKPSGKEWSTADYQKGYVSEPGYAQLSFISAIGIAKLKIVNGKYHPKGEYQAAIAVPFDVSDSGQVEASSVATERIMFAISPGAYKLIFAQYMLDEDTRLGDILVADLFFEPVDTALTESETLIAHESFS